MNPITNPVIEAILGSGDGNIALAILMARLFRTIMVVGGLALLLYMAWGGISWITAGGDKGKAEEARTRITNAIIGMAFLVATAAVAMFLSGVFGFNLLNPTLPEGTSSSGSTTSVGSSSNNSTCSNSSAAQCQGRPIGTACGNAAIPSTCRPGSGNTTSTTCICAPTQ